MTSVSRLSEKFGDLPVLHVYFVFVNIDLRKKPFSDYKKMLSSDWSD